ncbi:30S ribosomal protein S8 [Candidatus Gottesmanbacteria bacterium]|nr:30S ribosomal protein S8 [Candidatus Gottesmanbacteria bacterium]
MQIVWQITKLYTTVRLLPAVFPGVGSQRRIKRISKPSLRIYAGKNKLPRVLGGAGIAIISTPKGLMTNREAYKANLGGEIICEIW